MLPYFATFGLSIVILIITKNWSRNGVGFKFWTFIAVLLPCILAGLRSTSIGTDVQNYAEPLFNLASSSNTFMEYYQTRWLRFWAYASPSDFEIGYVILVWISSRLFSSVYGLLFLSQVLVIAPIYLTLSHYRNRNVMLTGMCVYYFLYFNQSLNLMRQWIAIAFVFSGVIRQNTDKIGFRKYIKSILLILIGVSFHNSALFGFLILLLRIYIGSGKEDSLKKVVLVAIISIVMTSCLGPAATLLNSIGLGRYVGYLGMQSIHLMPNQIILRLPMIIFAICAFRRSKEQNNFEAFILCMAILAIVFSQYSSLWEQSGRIGLYFDSINIILPAILLRTFNLQDIRRIAIWLVLVSYCIIYWVYYYVISLSGETIPYLIFWN